LAQHAEAALVLDEQRIELRRRGRRSRPQSPAGLGLALYAARRGSGFAASAAAARACEEREEWQRHADDRAPPDELAPADLAGCVLVDDVVLDLVAARPDLIDAALGLIHAEAPFQI
jgi:hypothetical protein